MRALQDRQQSALGAYLTLVAKAERLREQLEGVEAEMVEALGSLSAVCTPEVASDLTGASLSRAREAAAAVRRARTGDTAAGAS